MDKIVPDWITQKAVNFVIKRLKNVDPNTKKKLASALQKEANEYASANQHYDYDSLVERLETRIPSSMARSASPSGQRYAMGETYPSSQPTMFFTSTPQTMCPTACGYGASAGDQTTYQYQRRVTPSGPAYYYETQRPAQSQKIPSSGYPYGNFVQTVPAGCGCTAEGSPLSHQAPPQVISTGPGYRCETRCSIQPQRISPPSFVYGGSYIEKPPVVDNRRFQPSRVSNTWVPSPCVATPYGSGYLQRQYPEGTSCSYARSYPPYYGRDSRVLTRNASSPPPNSFYPAQISPASPLLARDSFYEHERRAYRESRVDHGNPESDSEQSDQDTYLNYSDDERLARRSKLKVSILADGTLFPSPNQRQARKKSSARFNG